MAEISPELQEPVWLGAYQLTWAMLDVLTRELGPNFAGAVREELLARADGLDRKAEPDSRAAAASARAVAGEKQWDDLIVRRPLWTRHKVPE